MRANRKTRPHLEFHGNRLHLSSEERGGGRREREESEIICVFESQRMSEKDVW